MANPKPQNQQQESQPPRVRITYDVETGNSVEKRELPFILGVFADLRGNTYEPTRLRGQRFTRIDSDNFQQVLAKLAPGLRITVDNKVTDDGAQLAMELRFRDMRDFEPGSVAAQIPALHQLVELRGRLHNLRSAVRASDKLDDLIQSILLRSELPSGVELQSAIDELLELRLFGHFEEEKATAREWLDAFFNEAAAGRIVATPDTEAILTERIAAIDELLSLQLNEVLHDPEFQRLEASWRGLEYLVSHTLHSPWLRIEVLAVSKRDLLRDMQRAFEFDHTEVFRKVYEEAYGTLGGCPYTALIGDYEFGRHPQDVELLQQLSSIGAAANAPFIGAAGPGLFNLETFRDLSRPRDLDKIFDNDAYVQWKSFRESEDSNYAGLVLPHILCRLPYGRNGQAAEGFDYEEGVDGSDNTKYLWGTAVYAFAARLTDAFARYGWCASVSGPERGGTVRGLPVHTFINDEGDTVMRCPTEIAITDRRRDELNKLGFIPLCHRKGSDEAVFFQARSCRKPALYMDDTQTVAARCECELEYILSASRFAHYMRCILRDKYGSFRSRAQAEQYLNLWLSGYVLLDENAPDHVRARYPLREARLSLTESPGYPARYHGTIYIRPHFQVADQNAPLRISTSLSLFQQF